ncbi:hypothetical protein [Archangium primigenium]|uniref:hypothetical protein n=1 Tax=[Archangium] primigenium TaxID=2792470 RepID=UPI0019581CDA|nr:hypothetical protein [Archangium primigenium]MBM7116020.1 hypothetical protein [Archangium primigenium]
MSHTPRTGRGRALLAGALSLLSGAAARADDAPFGVFQLGEGTLKLGGALRFRADVTLDAPRPTSGISWDVAWLNLGYDSPTFFGAFQYRFYGGVNARGYPDTTNLGEENYVTFAYLGYNLTDRQRLTLGMNQVPFGILPWVSSSFYQTLANVIGLEDVHNVGVKYNYVGGALQVAAAYNLRDGGSYFGPTRDANRYSIGFVQHDSYVEGGTNSRERHQFVGRVAYTLFHGEKSSSEFGASGLYSRIQNLDLNASGSRVAAALHWVGNHGGFRGMVEGGLQRINPRNPDGNTSLITLGGFGGSFNVATRGTFLSVDLSYSVPGSWEHISGVRPYLNYSVFTKDNAAFKTSHRAFAGTSFFLYDRWWIAAEFRFGRNDPYTGSYVDGLGVGGDDLWHKAYFMNVGFYYP